MRVNAREDRRTKRTIKIFLEADTFEDELILGSIWGAIVSGAKIEIEDGEHFTLMLEEDQEP